MLAMKTPLPSGCDTLLLHQNSHTLSGWLLQVGNNGDHSRIAQILAYYFSSLGEALVTRLAADASL